MSSKEKLRYTVLTKDGKVKSYLDKSWCYCSTYPEAHKHSKTNGRSKQCSL